MNKIISFAKKYIGELIIIVGTGILSHGIFSFSYETSVGSSGFGALPKLGKEMIQGVAYYYSNDAINLISIGAILIVLGIIITKNKK